MSAHSRPWGRLLIAGGTDFAVLGRKDKSGKNVGNPQFPEVPAAEIVREVANIKFRRVFASHSGCHAVAITVDDQAYLIGRNDRYQLSHPLPAHLTTPHLGPDNIPSPTPAAPQPFALASLPDANVPPALKNQRIVSAAVGRAHTVLVTKKGEAWTAGWNACGQCGHPESTEHIASFKRVKGPLVSEQVVSASCGISHSLFLTASGKVFAVGTGEMGVLGNGATGEHIAGSRRLFTVQSEPEEVEGVLKGKKIVEIASGQQHNVALDDEGYAYSWGFGGLGRLGIGAQVDALSPVLIPQFSGANPLTRCAKITAGSTNTLFIDRMGMTLLCGKWKTSGDGSAGQPWMTPRLVQDLQGYKGKLISAGGVTLFYHSSDDGGLTVAWGQNANSRELALGEGAAKSATKPTRIDYLDGVEMLDIAAGQATTYFVARPPATQAEKDEAKAAAAITEPVPVAAPAAPVEAHTTAPPAAASSSSSSSAIKPAIDLSGFGFDFGPGAGSPSASSTPPPPKPAPTPSVGGPEVFKPSATQQGAWEELQRWPALGEGAENCAVCGGYEADEVKGEILECEKCEGAYHAGCNTPPIQGIPDGEWFCANCKEPELLPDEEEDEAAAGTKRKADEGEDAVSKKRK
ncbi:hypothetical protein JCM8097_001269 [Rhodosporidiobolus ruineniae]